MFSTRHQACHDKKKDVYTREMTLFSRFDLVDLT